ncbi:MAG: hypothetical protein V4447_14055 [Pseudomonadota bacterium]
MTNKVAPEPPGDSILSNRKRFLISVRTKGLIVFFALIVYSIVIAIFAFHQKGLMLRDFEEIQTNLETESMLKQAETSSFHAVMAIFASVDAQDKLAGMPAIQINLASLRDRQAELAARLPENSFSLSNVNAAWNDLDNDVSKINLNKMSVELIKTKDQLAALIEKMESERGFLAEHYRAQGDSVAMTTFLLGILGLGLLGAIIGLFFRRLTNDLEMLQSRA